MTSIPTLARPILLVCALLVFSASLPASEEAPPGRMLIGIDLEKSPSSIKRDLLPRLDVTTVRPGGLVEALVTEEERSALLSRGAAVSVLREDVDREQQERAAARGAGNLADYSNYAQMKADFQSLAMDHPDRCRYEVIGLSLEGNEIFALKISDSPDLDEDEPEVLYCALHHSREPLSGEIVRSFAHHLLESYGIDPRVTAIVDTRELWLVPVVNPDGYLYVDSTDSFWRKNRRGGFGVDLNRNYGTEWGYNDEGSSPSTASQTYRGAFPFSEPETRVLRDFVDSREFVFSYDLHSYGDLYLPPWGYSPRLADDFDVLLHHGQTMAAGNGYAVGPPPLLLYPANGVSIDYCYDEVPGRSRILAYTPEVGPWFYPDPALIPSLVLENREPMLYLAEQASDPYDLFPPNPPVTCRAGTVLAFSNDHAHGRDIPVLYEVEELTGLSRATDDFEGGLSGWEPSGFAVSAARAFSGASSVHAGSSPSTAALLASQTGLVVLAGDVLTFRTWYDLEPDYDFAYVQVSIDGGVSWESLPGNLTIQNDVNGFNAGHGMTGSSGGWALASFPLAVYEGQEIRVRFAVLTDQATTREGFYVDDVFPREVFSQSVGLGTVAASSLPLPPGTGIHHYRTRGFDDDGQASGWGNRVTVDHDAPLLVEFFTDDPDVPAGQRLRFTARLTNPLAEPVDLDFWLEADLPDGSPYGGNPFVLPRRRTLPAMSMLERSARLRIPARLRPRGPFTLHLRAGCYPVVGLEDALQFSIVP